MITELFFEKIPLKSWSILVENSEHGGLGLPIWNLIKSLKKFEASGDPYFDLYYFLKDLGLERIGSGSQRVVYDIDGDHVIKAARGPGGLEANRKESNMEISSLLSMFLPKVYASADDYSWIIMEKVIPATDLGRDLDDWFEDFGIITPKGADEEFTVWLLSSIGVTAGDRRKPKEGEIYEVIAEYFEDHEIPNEELNRFLESSSFSILLRFATEMGRESRRVLSDFHSGNVGYTMSGKPVILDWG